jgi:hypothetical protein
MAQGKRNRLTTEQRIEMWRRWKAGESLHEIGEPLVRAWFHSVPVDAARLMAGGKAAGGGHGKSFGKADGVS